MILPISAYSESTRVVRELSKSSFQVGANVNRKFLKGFGHMEIRLRNLPRIFFKIYYQIAHEIDSIYG